MSETRRDESQQQAKGQLLQWEETIVNGVKLKKVDFREGLRAWREKNHGVPSQPDPQRSQ